METDGHSDGEMPAGRSWYVLHVKPRTEKKVMLYLARYGCFRYLPLVLKVTKVQRRKVRRTIPVFPGYVFSRMTPEERIEMLKTNLIVSAICIGVFAVGAVTIGKAVASLGSRLIKSLC